MKESAYFDNPNFIAAEIREELVIQLFQNCIDSNRPRNLQFFAIAINLLHEHKSLLGGTKLEELIASLFKNYFEVRDIIRKGKSLNDTVLSFLNLVEENIYVLEPNLIRNLVTKLFESCSNTKEFCRLKPSFVYTLNEYKPLLGQSKLKQLVILLLEKSSRFSDIGKLENFELAQELLTAHKKWLITEHYELYQNKIILLFNHANSFTQKVLEEFGEDISAEVIRHKYETSDSTNVAQSLRAYVEGIGLHRRIELPRKPDAEDRPLVGITFEAPNFITMILSKADDSIKKLLETIISEFTSAFTLEDLRDKFNLIENEDKKLKTIQALENFLESKDYKMEL